MLSVQIGDVRTFMHRFLLTDTFDGFRLTEAEIVREYTFSLKGGVPFGYYGEDEVEIPDVAEGENLPYGYLREMISEQIKGQRKPLSCRFVLSLPREGSDAGMVMDAPGTEAVKEFLLRIDYDARGLRLTTGINYLTFTPQRDAALLWDDWVQDFLKELQVDWTVL